MLPLLALIPGLLWTGAKYVGPMLADHSTQIAGILEGVLAKSPTGAKIVQAFESVLGPIEAEKKQEFTLELDSMLGNIDIDKIEASADSKTFTPRTTLFWGLSVITLLHLSIAEMSNIMALIHGQPLAPMDNITVIFLGGLLGLYHITKTIEKVNSNQDSQDSQDG